ncbi:hypothetical protein ACJZ2D_011780 [Fusarium nematophilum]
MSGLEILGAVASSIAIGQAVNGTRKAVKKLREIRHIRQHCDNLAKEIALIELFIKSASQHASPRGRAPRPSGPQEEYQLVSLTVQELDEIRKELDEIVDKYANPSRPHVGIRMKEKAEWLIEGQKIEELRQKAQKTRTDLGMGINFLVMSMIGGMAVQQEEQTQVMHAFTQHMASYSQAAQRSIEAFSRRLEDTRPALPQVTSCDASGSPGEDMGQIETTTETRLEQHIHIGNGSTEISTDSLLHTKTQSLSMSESGGSDRAMSIQEESLVKVTTIRPLGTPACGNDCQCRCHWNRQPSYSGAWMPRLLGSWLVRYQGIEGFGKLKCTERGCDSSNNMGVEGVGYQIAWEYSINPALRNSEIDVLLKKILSFVQGERFMQTTKVHRAAQQGEPVKQALEEQPWAINELDGRGQAPIHDAVSTNNMKVLEELIVAEADVNRRNWEGYTPLMLAQERGYLDMARTLLEHKECRRHINQQNNQGRTALHFAAFRGSPEGVRMLLEAGASAEKRNMWGETPLHELARSNNMDQAAAEIVRLLQDNKADLEARDNDGLTPALIAVEQNKVPVLRALINAGASLSAVTNYSFNILHVAALYANLEMLGYLVDLDLSDVDPQLLDSDRMAPLECLTWSAEVTDSFLGSNRRPSLAEQDAFLALYFDLLSRHLQRHLSTLKQLLRAAAQRDALTSRHLLGILIEQNHASRRQHLGDWYRDTGIGGYVEDDSWDSLIGCIEDEIQETWRKLHRVDATNKSLTDPEVQFFISEDPESDTED